MERDSSILWTSSVRNGHKTSQTRHIFMLAADSLMATISVATRSGLIRLQSGLTSLGNISTVDTNHNRTKTMNF